MPAHLGWHWCIWFLSVLTSCWWNPRKDFVFAWQTGHDINQTTQMIHDDLWQSSKSGMPNSDYKNAYWQVVRFYGFTFKLLLILFNLFTSIQPNTAQRSSSPGSHLCDFFRVGAKIISRFLNLPSELRYEQTLPPCLGLDEPRTAIFPFSSASFRIRINFTAADRWIVEVDR